MTLTKITPVKHLSAPDFPHVLPLSFEWKNKDILWTGIHTNIRYRAVCYRWEHLRVLFKLLLLFSLVNIFIIILVFAIFSQKNFSHYLFWKQKFCYKKSTSPIYLCTPFVGTFFDNVYTKHVLEQAAQRFHISLPFIRYCTVQNILLSVSTFTFLTETTSVLVVNNFVDPTLATLVIPKGKECVWMAGLAQSVIKVGFRDRCSKQQQSVLTKGFCLFKNIHRESR